MRQFLPHVGDADISARSPAVKSDIMSLRLACWPLDPDAAAFAALARSRIRDATKPRGGDSKSVAFWCGAYEMAKALQAGAVDTSAEAHEKALRANPAVGEAA